MLSDADLAVASVVLPKAEEEAPVAAAAEAVEGVPAAEGAAPVAEPAPEEE
jgi:hypothetical protein